MSLDTIFNSSLSFLASTNPIEHVLDKKFSEVGSLGWVSMHLVTLLTGAILAILFLSLAANAIAVGPASMGNRRYLARGRLGQLVETIIVGLRDSMLVPILGEAQTRRYLPFLLSLFFFILSMNLLGLIPIVDLQHLIGGWFFGNEHWAVIGGTPTSNIAVNAALATVVFVVIQIHSLRELGLKGWFEHLCGGHELVAGPKGLLLVVPIILVVELLGLIIKPAALCIRLFANMVGGHTLMATLLGFGAMAYNPEATNKALNYGLVGGVSLLAGGFAIAITFLELFVAFLQAFIFMFLTAVFISQMSHHDEEHAHDESHDHDHSHGHAAAHAH
ncbi:MAG: F0F1 ATP synthase subunit A [Phycisphaerae bacterium]|jgi:F-type H+-transporting ATPase subunit a|nr:F0F1 ATP synthase subunit A [Phycisphaerae bacterium]